MYTNIRRTITLAMLALALPACGDDGTGVDGPGPDGEYSASFTGFNTYEKTGSAYWYDDSDGTHIILGSTGWVGLNLSEAAPPSTGSKTLAGGFNATNQATIWDGARFWMSESGTATVSSADSDVISGTFDFIATYDTGSGVDSLHVTGEFEAVCMVSEDDTSRC